MDFSFGEEQIALRDLAREILEREMTPELLKEVEAGSDGFHPGLWAKLASANLLSLAVPEEHGGMGYGMLELCTLLEEVGRCVAPVPALPALVLGGLPVARFGTPAQQERWLPALAAGEAILTAALLDPDAADVTAPAARARRDGDGWRLQGRKSLVPAAHLARRVLVPAAADAGVGLFLVDPSAEGVRVQKRRISTGEILCDLELNGARVGDDDLLGGDARGGEERLAWLFDCARVATAALQVGVSGRALDMTVAYVKQREQFGAPIGSFPPVQHRCADCYIDLEALRWTTWRAAWRLSADLPASREAAVAKFWAADAGARVATAAQHLHGGMGADRDYPLHRYFLWTVALELSLGGATPQLVRLGRDMARTGPQEHA